MKKCPFCAEVVQDEAVICKHCKIDLTTKKAKQAFEKARKADLLKEGQAKKEQKRLKHEEYLKNLSPEEKLKLENTKKRKKSISKLWWVAGILALIFFGTYPYISMLILLIGLWMHPLKEENKAILNIDKFKQWKRLKGRIALSFLIVFICFAQASGVREQRLIVNHPEPNIKIEEDANHSGAMKEYNLQFTVIDYTEVLINNEPIVAENGTFKKLINLDKPSTAITILAKNKYKNYKKTITIKRDLTEEEIKEQKEAEQIAKQKEEERKAKELAEQQKWERSKAGQICKSNPEWTRSDCERLADNRIWIGMTIDMLKYKRGLPNSASPSNYGYGNQWQWCWWDYDPSCFYGGDDGVITSYN